MLIQVLPPHRDRQAAGTTAVGLLALFALLTATYIGFVEPRSTARPAAAIILAPAVLFALAWGVASRYAPRSP